MLKPFWCYSIWFTLTSEGHMTMLGTSGKGQIKETGKSLVCPVDGESNLPSKLWDSISEIHR